MLPPGSGIERVGSAKKAHRIEPALSRYLLIVSQPILVLVTGLQGTGKSTVAGSVADILGAPVIAHDWAMSGLRPFPELQEAMDTMEPPGHGRVGWSLLRAVGRSQLRCGSSVILDGVARAPQVEKLRLLAEEEGAQFFAIMTECSDPDLHRFRVESRDRGIPDWYELDWSHVERSRKSWDPSMAVNLKVDTFQSLSTIQELVAQELAKVR
jgi:predicted kinase